jgi:hypothetical protein
MISALPAGLTLRGLPATMGEMPMSTPVTTFDQEYSDPAATATGWEETRRALEEAELFWVSTVRADGRPHVTPVVAVWAEGALRWQRRGDGVLGHAGQGVGSCQGRSVRRHRAPVPLGLTDPRADVTSPPVSTAARSHRTG